MLFGNRYTGEIKFHKKQYIATKVFCFIIPIFVVSTAFITSGWGKHVEGIEIKPHRISFWSFLIRIITFLGAFFSIGVFFGNDDMKYMIVPSVIFSAGAIYSLAFMGRSSPKEKFVRDQFGIITGLFLVPGWLKEKEQNNFFNSFKAEYQKLHKDKDWSNKIQTVTAEHELFALYFSLTALEAELNADENLKNLLNDIVEKSVNNI